MIRIIRNHQKIPSMDECRGAVQAFMENETLKFYVLSAGSRYVMDWKLSITSPEYIKTRIEALIIQYGAPLLQHCFNEWKSEFTTNSEESE